MSAGSNPTSPEEGNSHTHSLEIKNITHLKQNKKPIGTYAMHEKLDSSFPQYSIDIDGEKVPFMVDSGATHSVIRHTSLTRHPKMSDRVVFSISASGQTAKERFTAHLLCTDEQGGHFNTHICCPNYAL